MKSTIVIHHSLTKDGNTVSWDDIRRYHMQTNGWNDIGYHWGIEKVDGVYETFLGRMPDEPGAHCKELGMNSKGIGICLVGNFDEEEPSTDQLFKAQMLCAYLCREYGIAPNHILGHREVGLLAGYDWEKGQYKSCPGRLFDMENFRLRVKNVL